MKDLSKATPEQLSDAFSSHEPFKAVAVRLGMSPNTLRKRWLSEFGQEAFDARGKRCQLEGMRGCKEKISKPRQNFAEDEVVCTRCAKPQRMRRVRSARLDQAKFVCDRCKGLRLDHTCPICSQKFVGRGGLSRHLAQRQDEAHQQHLRRQEDAVWSSRLRDKEYVVCHLCGHKADTLARHLLAVHQITAHHYRLRFGESALIRSEELTERRSRASKNREQTGKGRQKTISCPGCGVEHPVSQFHAQGTHDPRCSKCQTTPWEGPLRLHLAWESLLPYCLKNGKLSLSRAIRGLGLNVKTIRREARRHGMPIRNNLVSQHACLEAVSRALGGTSYIEEWNDERFINPKTGRRFRFDGFFPAHNLVVEFHGHQHWRFPNLFMKHERHRPAYEALLARDAMKEQLVKSDPTLTYLIVREDEPFAEDQFLRDRLADRTRFPVHLP